MTMEQFEHILEVFTDIYLILILAYAIAIMSSYLVLAYLSMRELRDYRKKNYFVDYNVLLSSYSPGI